MGAPSRRLPTPTLFWSGAPSPLDDQGTHVRTYVRTPKNDDLGAGLVAELRDEVKKQFDLLKQLSTFLDKQERNYPAESIPSDKREADKQLKVLKGILDQLYENQGQLDTAKVNIKDLLKKNPDAPGSEILDDNLNEIVMRWKELQEKCKARANMLEEMKDFHDIHDNLNNWLNSKASLR